MADKTRAHAIITGIVQGVFFRMETQRTAEQHAVAGWVRNKRDGSVEAVFEDEKTKREVFALCPVKLPVNLPDTILWSK